MPDATRGGKGKRGGVRVVYYFHANDVSIFLVAVYAKNEKADLTEGEKKEFAALLKELVARWRRK
jgi:hypothetical protein